MDAPEFRHLLLADVALVRGAVSASDVAAALQRYWDRRHDTHASLADELMRVAGTSRTVIAELEAEVDRLVSACGGDARLALTRHGGVDRSLPLALTRGQPGGAAEQAEQGLRTVSSGRYLDFLVAGAGGMGVVYLALDTELSRLVAFKMVNPDASEAPSGSAPEDPLAATPPPGGSHASTLFAALKVRLLQEAWVTGGLEHPGIVPVYEMGRTPHGIPYYTMRYVRGQRTLAQAIAEANGGAQGLDGRGSKASPQEARTSLLEPFLKLCDTVAYAHSRGVIHRDIKPSNVALGEFGEVVLLDWGLATLKHGDPLLSSVWRERFREVEPAAQVDPDAGGGGGGTPGYMAPEAIPAGSRIDERVDVYALGVVLFEILTGRLPHAFGSLSEYVAKVTERDAPVASSVEPSVPAALDAICARALARDPAERTPTARELAGAVREWQRASAREREVDARLREAELALEAAEPLQADALLQQIDLAKAALARIPKDAFDDPRAKACRRKVHGLHQRGLAERDSTLRRRLTRRLALGMVLVAAATTGAVLLWQRGERERMEGDRARLEGENARLSADRAAERERAAQAEALAKAAKAEQAILEKANAELAARQAGERERLAQAEAAAKAAEARTARVEAQRAAERERLAQAEALAEAASARSARDEAQQAVARERSAQIAADAALAAAQAEQARIEEQRLAAQERVERLEQAKRAVETQLELARARKQIVAMRAESRSLVLGAYALTFGASRPDLGLFLSREAVRTSPSPLASANLAGALTACPLRRVAWVGRSEVVELALEPAPLGVARSSRDLTMPAPPRRLLARLADGGVMLWDRDGEARELRAPGDPRAVLAWFDRGQKGVRIGLADGRVLLVDLDGQLRGEQGPPAPSAWPLGQSDDGRLVHRVVDGTRTLVNRAGEPSALELPAHTIAKSVRLDPSGRWITGLGAAPAGTPATVFVWRLGEAAPSWVREVPAEPAKAAGSLPTEAYLGRDATTLILRTGPGLADSWLWSVEDVRWSKGEAALLDALGGGDTLLVEDREQVSVRRRAPRDGQTTVGLGAGEGGAVLGCLSEDGTEAAVVSRDGTLRQFSLAPWGRVDVGGRPVQNAVASRDGTRVLCMTLDAQGRNLAMLVDTLDGTSRPVAADLLERASEPWLDRPRAADRVVRGGSFADEPGELGPVWRERQARGTRWRDVGFRLVRAVRPSASVERPSTPDDRFSLLAAPRLRLDAPVAVPDWLQAAPEQLAEARRLQTAVGFEDAATGVRFVLIPGGFLRQGAGSPEDQRGVERWVPPFYMAVTETTNAQYTRLAPAPPSIGEDRRSPDWEAEPVVGIDHAQAEGYAALASERSAGYRFVLPSEAQWEYACKALARPLISMPGMARVVPQSNQPSPAGHPMDDTAWHAGNSNRRGNPVGRKRANAWGLHDTLGNVAEWCADDWHEDATAAPTHELQGVAIDPTGERLLTWHRKGEVWLWSRDGARPLAPPRYLAGPVEDAVLLADGAYALSLTERGVLLVGADGSERLLTGPSTDPRRLVASADGRLFAAYVPVPARPIVPAPAPLAAPAAAPGLACGAGGKACGPGDERPAPALPVAPPPAPSPPRLWVWSHKGEPFVGLNGMELPEGEPKQVELREDGGEVAIRLAAEVRLVAQGGALRTLRDVSASACFFWDGTEPCLLERKGGDLLLRRGESGPRRRVNLSGLHASAGAVHGDGPGTDGPNPCDQPHDYLDGPVTATVGRGRALVDLRYGLWALLDVRSGEVIGLTSLLTPGHGCAPLARPVTLDAGDRLVANWSGDLQVRPLEAGRLLRAADQWLLRRLTREEMDLFGDVLEGAYAGR